MDLMAEEDNEDPVVTCRDVRYSNNAYVEWEELVEAFSDNIGAIVRTGVVQTSYPVGSTEVLVTVADDAGNEGSCIATVTVEDVQTEVNVDSVSTTSATLSWTPIPGSLFYRVFYTGPDGVEQHGNPTTDPTTTVTGLTPGTVYTFRLESTDQGGQIVLGNVASTTVSCPTLSAPANGSAIVTINMAGGVARFVCDAGFKLSHVVNLTCQSDGTWSAGDMPTCISESMTPLGPVLPTPLIIGISVGSVILIVFIMLVIILICRPKKLPPSSRTVNPSTDQAAVHENPTYIQ